MDTNLNILTNAENKKMARSMLIIINISHELGELEVFVALIHDIRELSMQFVLTVDETLKHLKSN